MWEDQYILPLGIGILRWRQVFAWFIHHWCSLSYVYLWIWKESDTCGFTQNSLLGCWVWIVFIISALVESSGWDNLLQIKRNLLQLNYLLDILFNLVLELINVLLQVTRDRIVFHILGSYSFPPPSSFFHLLQHIHLLKPLFLVQLSFLVLLLTQPSQIGLLWFTHPSHHSFMVVLCIIQLSQIVILQT